MTERRSDRILSIVLSILIHAAIVGALLWGWWQYRQPTTTAPSLAIEATVQLRPRTGPGAGRLPGSFPYQRHRQSAGVPVNTADPHYPVDPDPQGASFPPDSADPPEYFPARPATTHQDPTLPAGNTPEPASRQRGS